MPKLKGSQNGKTFLGYIGFVELGDAMHDHRAVMNTKHDCVLLPM